jgi:hypothetical protein
MNNIIEPTMDYDFSKLYLGPPSTLTGGAYFTRLMYENNKQLFIQTPKSLTKQGFVKSGKKIYVDLMFDNNDTIFINWIENLETKCQQLMFEKSEQWFETKIEKDDIETAFTSVFKIFKSGKYYLLRVNVKPNIKIYNEMDAIVSMDDVTTDKNVISILEIQGIKFTSRNFQIEIELKQSMMVSPDPFLDECFIKKPMKKEMQQSIEDVKPQTIEENNSSIKDFIKESANQLNDNSNISVTFDTNLTSDIDKVPQKLDSTEPEAEPEIDLEIEDLTPQKPKEENDGLKEIDLATHLENTTETITLKKHNQVYYEIYQKAREKAKEAKKAAINAYMELKQIKKTYMLDDIDESDDSILDNIETDEDFSENEDEDEDFNN